MAHREFLKIKKLLTSFLGERGLVASYIVLFGSSARGDGQPDSDLDLIVVSKEFSNQDIFDRVERTRGIHRRLVHELKRPVDLMFFSEDEWLNGSAPILNYARQEGTIL